MEITVRWLHGTHVLALSGNPGLEGTARLRGAFREALGEGRRQFVLNLQEVGSLDSLTLGELVGCVKRAREHKGDVRLVVVPDGIVHELLQLAGLDRVFRIFGDEGEAAASYGKAAS